MNTNDRIIKAEDKLNRRVGLAVWACALLLVAAALTGFFTSCASTPKGTQRRVQNYAALVVQAAVQEGDISADDAPKIASVFRSAAQAIRVGEFAPGESMALAAKVKTELSARGYGALIVDIVFTEADVYLLEHGPENPTEKAAAWADFLDGVAVALETVEE